MNTINDKVSFRMNLHWEEEGRRKVYDDLRYFLSKPHYKYGDSIGDSCALVADFDDL